MLVLATRFPGAKCSLARIIFRADSIDKAGDSSRREPGLDQWQDVLDDFADSPVFDKPIRFLDDSRESIYREREDRQL